MADLPSVRPTELHGGLASSGYDLSVTVWAWCQCGFTGPRRASLAPETRQLEQADLEEHLAMSGHTAFLDGTPGADGLHRACGHFHDFQDSCPAPPDSPRGQLGRAMRATLNDPTAALDRLAAIAELRSWLEEQEQMAVIGARMSRATWAEMGSAIGTSRQGAWNRWGTMVRRYEEAGLLDDHDTVTESETAQG
jgi:hypothetical protein